MFRFLYLAPRRSALAFVSLLILVAAGGIFWHSRAIATASSNDDVNSSGHAA